jgi:hypothetical protein
VWAGFRRVLRGCRRVGAADIWLLRWQGGILLLAPPPTDAWDARGRLGHRFAVRTCWRGHQPFRLAGERLLWLRPRPGVLFLPPNSKHEASIYGG